MFKLSVCINLCVCVCLCVCIGLKCCSLHCWYRSHNEYIGAIQNAVSVVARIVVLLCDYVALNTTESLPLLLLLLLLLLAVVLLLLLLILLYFSYLFSVFRVFVRFGFKVKESSFFTTVSIWIVSVCTSFTLLQSLILKYRPKKASPEFCGSVPVPMYDSEIILFLQSLIPKVLCDF